MPPSYQEFDTFARTLASRRDCLFLVLSNQECTDERVDVWEIPADYDWEEPEPPFWTTPLRLRHYYFDSSPSTDHNPRNEHPEQSSRLIEFLIQVCTDPILWFDRQTTAPIAFAEHRRVHAVLFVDMHRQVMELVESVVADAAKSSTQQEEQAAQPNEDADDAAENARLSMDHFPLLRKQRAAVDQFRRACRQHWLRTVADSSSSSSEDDDKEASRTNTFLLDRDMVCLVVPSTEIRVLTTWGIDVWSPLDAEFMTTVGDDDDDRDRSTATAKAKQTLPALLITDQRYGGTRRYYYNQTEEAETNQGADDYRSFITSFWEGQLQYDIKSSSPRSKHAHTNEAGVRILTADSLDTELLSSLAPPPRGDLSVSDNVGQQQQQHALILFTAPTCGHCKRFLVIWNHLARLLQHIGWSSFLTLYQMDVTENDVASTLNLTIQWLPDLYYSYGGDDGTAAPPPQQPHEHHHPLPHHRRVFIRYNRTDAVGDGVGAVRDSTEILDWLVQLDAFADAKRAAELLSHLNQHPRQPDATATTQKG